MNAQLLLAVFRKPPPPSSPKDDFFSGSERPSRLGDGALSKASSSTSNSLSRRAASYVATAANKLLWSTGRAVWITGTDFLVLAVPLMIEMDREQQMNELDMQQASLLGATPSTITGAGSVAPAM